MVILVDENTMAIVQGITGGLGLFATRSMLDAGTKIVAGVTPGKGGDNVYGIPVYDSIEDVLEDHPEADATVCYVPPQFTKDAAFEAISHGLSRIVLPAEGVPLHDALKITNYAKIKNIYVAGPTSLGFFSPGKSKLGTYANLFFKEGEIGIVARGGTITYEVSAEISSVGLGVSTCVHIGDDRVTGMSFADVLRLFEKDNDTKTIVMIGEIGGTFEESAAGVIEREISKPVIALINGRTAPPGKQMGHAGAIVERGTGDYKSKVDALRGAGVPIAKDTKEVGRLLRKAMI